MSGAGGAPADVLNRVLGESSVSRETLGKLQTYADLLLKWQRTINLVAPSTLGELWLRHMGDSLQLLPLIPPCARTIADLGSGGGFPGLALAIALTGMDRDVTVHLLESDTRKAAFLRTVVRATAAPAIVHSTRIEATPPLRADVITSRACAPLSRLLTYAAPHLVEGGICLFLKGQTAEAEIAELNSGFLTGVGKSLRFDIQRIPSSTDSSALVLRVEGASRA